MEGGGPAHRTEEATSGHHALRVAAILVHRASLPQNINEEVTMSKNNEHDPTTQRRCMWCTEEEREKLVAEGGEPYGTSCDILDYVSDNHCERHRIEAEQEYARWQERRVAQMSRHVEGSTHVVLHRPNGSEYHVTIEGFRDVEWWVEHLSGKGWITEQDLQKVRDAR